MIKEILERAQFLVDVGLEYLSLSRSSATLSGGEAQRIRLASQIGSRLVGVLYVLDEPSIGLHQRDNQRLIGTLERLRNLGNTVIVVEHDEETIRAADHVVDIGPGAGELGGEVVHSGPGRGPDGDRGATRRRSRATTSRGGAPSRCPPSRRPREMGELVVLGARANNLRDLDVVAAARLLRRGHRRLGLGEVLARERDPPQVAAAHGEPRARSCPATTTR